MGSGMEIQRWSKLTLLGPRFFFRIVDEGNRERLAASQRYKTVEQRNRTARRFAQLLRCPIRDVGR
jgi:hypothetical protein